MSRSWSPNTEFELIFFEAASDLKKDRSAFLEFDSANYENSSSSRSVSVAALLKRMHKMSTGDSMSCQHVKPQLSAMLQKNPFFKDVVPQGSIDHITQLTDDSIAQLHPFPGECHTNIQSTRTGCVKISTRDDFFYISLFS